MSNKLLSTEIEEWANSDPDKTVADLQKVFGQKSFAVLFLVFMFIPALPIPTGGFTNGFLIPCVMIGAMQMIFGRKSLWLPKRFTEVKLSEKTINKGLPLMIKYIKFLEKLSRPRKSSWFDNKIMHIIIGITVLFLAAGSWIAPPFSWLDTLPSLGIVLIALAMLLEDIAFYFAGLISGTLGLGIIIYLFKTIIEYSSKLINSLF